VIAYNSNELFSATEISKNFAKITSKLSKKELEKIGILKNNKLDFILLKSDDFEEIIKKEVEKALLKLNYKSENEYDLKNLQTSSMAKT